MGEDSGATVYAGGLNLGGTAITANAAELNYLDGVTSSIQTQLDNAGGSASSLNDLTDVLVDSDSMFLGNPPTNSTGGYNTASGRNALNSNTTGSNNTASGYESLFSNTEGEDNTASGAYSLYLNTTGDENTASGYKSLHYNTTGSNNTASGHKSLHYNTTGSDNSASGLRSLYKNTTGIKNTASGVYSLYYNTAGSHNTASGYESLTNNTTGNYNTASGYFSLQTNITGANNTAFGYNAMASTDNATNQTIIGYEATGQADNSVVLGNDDVTAVYMGEDSGAKVYAGEGSFTGNMTIGGDVVVSSDARLKANIMSLGSTLAKLLLIDGKRYTMKKNGKQKIGVLAQDIQKVFPELVTTDDKDMLAVNYQGLVPVLINALKEQDDKISRLEKLVEKLISDN